MARSAQRRVALGRPPARAEIANRPGLADDQQKMLEHAGDLHEFAESAKADGLEHACAARRCGRFEAGAGGASGARSGSARPDAPARARLDRPRRSARLRSGRGARQDALHRVVEVRQVRSRRCRCSRATSGRAHGGNGSQFCAVTDPGSPLVELAREQRLPARPRERPRTSAGRYSVLSYFGLVPGRARGRQHRGASSAGPQGGRAEHRAASTPRRPTRRLCLAARWAEGASSGCDKLDLRVGPTAGLELRSVGRSS